jgi:hypothetical protein
MLAGEIQGADTPARREARRQLHLETVALLSEIELALRDPTDANHSGVKHRAKVWNALLQHVRPALGICRGSPELRGALAGRPAEADRPPGPTGPASRTGGFFT